ncbi:MAG TPA: hypothetical protein VLX92_27600 [Kofleriaceae bacterium]|nr:hypothetical protein [Kofleriaceae bacterium]
MVARLHGTAAVRTAVALAILCAAPAARAEPEIGAGIEGGVLDLRGATAVAIGGELALAFGHGRLEPLTELSFGTLIAKDPTERVGIYGAGRLGVRWRALRIEGIDLGLDLGLGGERYWIDSASPADRAFGFAGWGTRIRIGKLGFALALRVEVAPKLDDPSALRVICRGTCTAPDDAPADLTMVIDGEVFRW